MSVARGVPLVQNGRMFTISQPSESGVERVLAHQRELPLSYPEVGATLGEPPAGYTVDRTRIRLGEGPGTFGLAASALSEWRHFETSWTRLLPAGAPVREGAEVCVVARHLGFYSMNPARIVRVLDERGRYPGYRRYGYVYGTLPAHSELGEERFSVELLPDGSVWYDLCSFARGGSALVRLGYPVRRVLQRRFARDSGRAMIRAVSGR
ncbi:DUF1990 domain-containing protein [Rubrobacter aplysinae]|uniref:DUF1990 domain-containing protein n=1 Tax=Rubrobacter aplysinae TaxID=909625 RepID=UPI0009FC090A|nr:DUF1990 domain-containing protein [Rubrobacter aplysinae]